MKKPDANGDLSQRRQWVLHLVARLQHEARLDKVDLYDACGHTRQRWDRFFDRGDSACIPLADVPVLSQKLGPGLFEALAEACGYRVVPALEQTATHGDVVSSTADAMKETGEALVTITAAGADGVYTPSEVAQIAQAGEEAMRSMARTIEVARAAGIRRPT